MERVAENNRILNELLGAAVQPLPLEQVLGNCLDILLTLSWLSLLPRAGIFLAKNGKDGEELVLVAERGLDPELRTLCATVPFGSCLCGRAAQTQMILHATCVDDRHERAYDGMAPHGHYCVPIKSKGRTLGMMVFYLPDGAQRYEEGVEFLDRVADTLSMVIVLNRQSQELAEKVAELDYQRRALDEHAIVSETDVDGVITYVNEKFCAISEYSREELIGANHRIVRSSEHSREFYREMWETIKSGRPWHGEIKNMKKSGAYYWVYSTIVPFLNTDGAPFKFVAIRTDITAEKEKEEELRIANQITEQANRTKSEFLATMSHEIRTPMNGILGMVGNLMDSGLTREQLDQLEVIKDSSDTLMRLLNDILDLSKIEAGRMELEYDDFSLSGLLEATAALWLPRAGAKEIDFKIRNLVRGEDVFRGDSMRIRQVLQNLISNALKFTHRGTITVYVTLVPRREAGGQALHVEVRDTGIGIDEPGKAKLFSPFSQADQSMTRQFGGTGLGLSISKKIVEMHGGRIGVESTPGAGSCFWFDVAIEKGEAMELPEAEQEGTDVLAGKLKEIGAGLRILVAEDNYINQKVLELVLSRALQCEIDFVSNGADAVSQVQEKDYSVVLMDIQMPEMDGVAATQAIRMLDNPNARDMPIIALTANAMKGDKERYLAAGMTDYVSKPIDPQALFGALLRTADAATVETPTS